MVEVRELTVHDLLLSEQASHARTKEKLREANEALSKTRLELKKVARRLGEKRSRDGASLHDNRARDAGAS
jgi:hypothetical protein